MAEIRLNKLIKKYNIGLQELVAFLRKQGADLDENPNAKISDEYIPALDRQYSKDLALKEASEKVDIKLTEILEKSSKKQNLKKEEDEEPVMDTTIIRSSTLTGISRPEPAPAKTLEKAEPEPEVLETAAPEETVAEPVVESEPEDKPLPEVVAEPEPEVQISPEPEPAPAAEVPEAKEDTAVETSVETPAETDAAEESEPRVDEAPEQKVEAQPVQETGGLKVLGKIDMSQFEKKKPNKKRERINKGSQKVDVGKVGSDSDFSKKNHGQKNGNAKPGQQRPGAQQNNNGKGNNKKKGNERFKPEMTEAEQEEMQKQIQKQVKETYAKMNDNKKNNFGAKYRKEKRELANQRAMEEMQAEAEEKKVLKVTEFVTVNDLATLMNNTPVVKVIGACMSLGLMVSINQRLDAETLVLVAEEFGYKVEFVTAEITDAIESNDGPDNEEDLVPRPPVITVMGHVDHGKTSLLDYIRKSNVIAGEAGGITQHIGAYSVKLEDGRHITFLDTPGHEAFTAMRARGAQMTDLAIIIIAADDAVMPQTIEAINHAQAAGVPMVFAINKIDKPGAFPDTIRRQLSEMNILVEDWGGKFQCQEISAKKGLNVDLLLEKVLLETDLLELKANPKKLASGAVIESSLDKGRGYLATILVQNGTLHVGDVILSGSYYGRVKSMFNERGQKVTEAGPSTPVSVLGLNGAPSAGEKFNVLADEREAKSIANKREQLIRIQGIKTQKHMTLEEIGRRIAIGNFKELNVIVKGDVDGSVEALSDSLIKLSTEQVRVNVIHKAVGAISESDILLAEASDAVVIGFQVRPSAEARKAAEKEGIEIRLYSVIYDCINEVKDGIEGMLEPEKKEEVTATAEVKQTFKISKVGTIAGCLVKDGKLTAKAQVRLIRNGIVVYTGELASLQRGKDQAKEVPAGMECGLSIERFNDIKEGDVVEAFQIVEIKRTL
ncbi:MAG: translation initiation factor IF-2 [Bacteroidales bacterium]|nr:translation initiation factor IF-2 [Bacteroidales bacterium]